MTRRFKMVDILYIVMMILPLCLGITLKVVTTPPSEGISIAGARIYTVINMPIQDLPVTESQINSSIVIVSVLFLCLYLTHGIKDGVWLKRHHIAELLVEKSTALVVDNMGEYFRAFAPFIAAILGLSGFSSLITLFGLYPPTSDVNIVAGWAILVFVLITYYKMKCGPLEYIKSFANPLLMAPLNVIGEVATPISMAFRHYGNVLSGSVISVLIAAGLQGLSNIIFGSLPGFFGEFPFLQVGLPAILSIYFDIFSGVLQAYIFAMLTMLYISGGFPLELYMERKAKKTLKYEN
ncbi:MAG: F0F1 ATP synthase subunit A [Clostridia bacterium]|nr:F0F1 ATP synthase subunit A [Clostridia bacterium]